MKIDESESRRERMLQVAKAMMTAVRTAPKARGRDNIETCVVEGGTLKEMAAVMRRVGEERGAAFFLRDADNIENSDCVVLIGSRPLSFGLNCGICGYSTCEGKEAEHAETPCAFGLINEGIALGTAAVMAADFRADNRIMYSAGVAARDLKLMEGCDNILAIPLSCGSKSIYFDR